jgi:hypothetical protein
MRRVSQEFAELGHEWYRKRACTERSDETAAGVHLTTL